LTRIAAMRGDRIVGALQMLMFQTGPDRRFGLVPRGPADQARAVGRDIVKSCGTDHDQAAV